MGKIKVTDPDIATIDVGTENDVETEKNEPKDDALKNRRPPYETALKESGELERLGVSLGAVVMLLPSMVLIENIFQSLERVSPTADTVVPLVSRWESEIVLVIKAYRKHILPFNIRHLYPMFSVALVTFRYQPERAALFWHRVWRQDGTSIDSPEREFSRFVSKMRLTDLPEDFYVRRVAEYWNAWFEDRPTGRVIDHNQPARIAGTPYTGEPNSLSGAACPPRDIKKIGGRARPEKVVLWRKRKGGSRG